MIELPLFPDYRPDLDWSKNRVDEAREFIKMVLTTIVKPGERFNVGFSGGKDSTVLLQLILEVIDELGGDYLQRLIVSSTITRYELNFQREHLERQLERIKKLGVDVRKIFTLWEESFGVVTLGVGVISQITKFRICNQMKSTTVVEMHKLAPINISGTRSEESPKRANQPRIYKYHATITTAAPIKHFLSCDVWGYLHHIGKTKWGLTYDELKAHYDRGGNKRDGCWVCCFHKGTEGYTPAQKRVIEKLDLIRGTTLRDHHVYRDDEMSKGIDYPGRTVDWPTTVGVGFYDLWRLKWTSRNCYRPINVCKQAYEIVKRIEREENEVGKIIFPEEHILIKDIHTFRERYHIGHGKRWMLNPEYWCGRKLLDLDPFTEKIYSQYKVPNYLLRRFNGDWFGRWAREYERIPLWRVFEKKIGIKPAENIQKDYNKVIENIEKAFKSGYVQDERVEPVPDFYKDGDPAAIQENCQMEIIAKTWNKS